MTELEQNLDERPGVDRGFHTTHWTVVVQAGDEGSPESTEALGSLCQSYWYPLYAFARREGKSSHDAQDLVQGFFEKVLEKGYLKSADPEKGRFRSFLLASFKHFIANEWRRSRQQKRGGGAPMLSLDHELAEQRFTLEPVDTADPERIFERHWALEVVDRALSQLQQEYAGQGKQALFDRLKGFLMKEPDTGTYLEAGTDLQLSESAVKSAIFRLRQRFGVLFRMEISHTVSTSQEVDDEIRHLTQVLA